VLEYYKSNTFRKGSKTTLKIKVGNKEPFLIETDKLRSEHCPEYKAIPHKTKVKTFAVTNLELATKEELEDLKTKVEKLLNAIYAKELKEKKRQEVLKTLTPEQREALGL
jgi:tRNA U54 and U55 pseudouridine synthase Pus10